MQVCGDHRTYAIWLLSWPLPSGARPRRIAKRASIYSEAAIDLLAQLWVASGYLCAVRKAALPQWRPWGRRRMAHSPALERPLVAISPRQSERRLQTRQQTLKRTRYGTMRPGSLLKHLIPVKTDQWDVTKASYLEMDLVSNSGACAAGEVLDTLDAVDIQTGWVESGRRS